MVDLAARSGTDRPTCARGGLGGGVVNEGGCLWVGECRHLQAPPTSKPMHKPMMQTRHAWILRTVTQLKKAHPNKYTITIYMHASPCTCLDFEDGDARAEGGGPRLVVHAVPLRPCHMACVGNNRWEGSWLVKGDGEEMSVFSSIIPVFGEKPSCPFSQSVNQSPL